LPHTNTAQTPPTRPPAFTATRNHRSPRHQIHRAVSPAARSAPATAAASHQNTQPSGQQPRSLQPNQVSATPGRHSTLPGNIVHLQHRITCSRASSLLRPRTHTQRPQTGPHISCDARAPYHTHSSATPTKPLFPAPIYTQSFAHRCPIVHCHHHTLFPPSKSRTNHKATRESQHDY
jgi:hypothetical protein